MKISVPYSEYMNSKIEKEGFHYAFVGYSDFKEVEDDKFHELRMKYLEATKKSWRLFESKYRFISLKCCESLNL